MYGQIQLQASGCPESATSAGGAGENGICAGDEGA